MEKSGDLENRSLSRDKKKEILKGSTRGDRVPPVYSDN